MENTSYALQIAAGTLIAIMIIALIVYVFNSMSTFQESQDEIVERESISEFNEAFEVYDKTLMYGTDVLSCLNKAENNNQKYVYSIYYGQDASTVTYEARNSYTVNVSVTLNSALEETIEISKKTSTGVLQTTDAISYNPFNTSNNPCFNLPDIEYYYFTTETSRKVAVNKISTTYDALMWDSSSGLGLLASSSKTASISADTYETLFAAGASDSSPKTYELVTDDVDSDAGLLIALLTVAAYDPEQTITNSTAKSSSTTGIWYSMTWSTAVTDFKTRKFKCTGMEYDETTGYINSISFVEV